MNLELTYYETISFQNQFKKIKKKLRSLDDDFKVVKKNVIELYHLKNIDNHGTFPIPGFVTHSVQVCKIKKFACKSLKGRGAKTGIRVVYAYIAKTKSVYFIEIYQKANQTNEDSKKIKDFLKTISL